MRSHLLLLAFAAACGGNDAKPDALIIVHPDARADADVDAPPATNTATVMPFGGTPAFVAYRDGNTAWQTPVLGSSGAYELGVTDDYTFVMVCADTSGFEAQMIGSSKNDSPQQYVYCGKNLGGAAPVAVTGHMAQAGTVYMTDSASSTTANWSFTLHVPPGTHDLTAFDTGHIAIQRDLAISGATALPAVDVVAGGSALVQVPLTISGRPAGDQLSVDYELGLKNDFAVVTANTPSLPTAPSSLLLPNDFQYAYIESLSGTSSLTAATVYTGSETSFALMPPLTGVAFDSSGGVVRASWSTLPAHDLVALYLGSQAGASYQSAQLTDSWLASHGGTHVQFDDSAPGYQAAWRIDVNGPYVRQLSALTTGTGIAYSSATIEGENGAMVRSRPQAAGSFRGHHRWPGRSPDR
jgi:hypothetical protein